MRVLGPVIVLGDFNALHWGKRQPKSAGYPLLWGDATLVPSPYVIGPLVLPTPMWAENLKLRYIIADATSRILSYSQWQILTWHWTIQEHLIGSKWWSLVRSSLLTNAAGYKTLVSVLRNAAANSLPHCGLKKPCKRKDAILSALYAQ